MTDTLEHTTERKAEVKRIQFEFSPDAYERLKRIREETDATSYAELVRNALRLYEWFIQQQKSGHEFALLKDDKVKEVKFVF